MKVTRSEIHPDTTCEHQFGIHVVSYEKDQGIDSEFYDAYFWAKENFGYEPIYARYVDLPHAYFWFKTGEHR
jgi:hypothetical protein